MLPQPSSEIVMTEFADNEGVLVDLATKRYYLLNETALLIWRSLEQARPRHEVIKELTETYEVSAEQAEQSLTRVLRELAQNGLLAVS